MGRPGTEWDSWDPDKLISRPLHGADRHSLGCFSPRGAGEGTQTVVKGSELNIRLPIRERPAVEVNTQKEEVYPAVCVNLDFHI